MPESSLGSLVVSLSAETSQFTNALNKAEYQMRQSMNRMSSAVSVLEKAFGALFGIAAGVGFAEMIKSSIEATAELGRVGARAGLTGEQMSSLSHAALLSHTSLDDMAAFSVKLSKALLLAQDATTRSAHVLKALGITSKDVARLLADPAKALLELSKRLDTLPEGGTKAAAQLLIVGRSGGTVSAAMNELAKQTELVATRTDAEIKAAKAFEDRLVEMHIKSAKLQYTFASALLPTMNDVVGAFLKAANEAGGLQAKLDALAADGSIREWAKDAVLALATVAEALVLIGRMVYSVTGSFRVVVSEVDLAIAKTNAPKFKPFGTLGFSKEEAEKGNADYDAALKRRNAILASANQNYEDLWNKNGAFITDALEKQFALTDAAAKAQADFPGNADANDLRNVAALDRQAKAVAAAKAANEKRVRDVIAAGAGGAKDDPRKAALERVLKELDAYIAKEKQLLAARDEYLKLYYAQGFISEKRYYDTRVQVLTDSTTVEVNTNQKKIEAINAYIKAIKDKKGAERLVEEAIKQRVGIETANAALSFELIKSTTLAYIESSEAGRLYEGTLQTINAELLALQGNTAAAAKITRDLSEVLERRRMAANNSTGAIAQLNEIDARKEAFDRLTEATNKYSLVVQRVGLAQAAADLKFQAGNVTELQAYAQRAEAARQMIPLLTAIADKEQAAAIATKDPKALLAVQQMRLEIARLAVDADALAKRFTDIFEGNFATFLTDIVNRTKTVKQAFLDMAKSIEQSISQIAAKNIAEQVFSKGGQLGGLGAMFAKAFGDKGAGGSTADAALASLSTAASGATLAIDADVKAYLAVALAADAAATALSAVAGSSAASGIGSAFFGGGSSGLGGIMGPGGIFGFAEGTPFVQKDMLAFLHRGEAVIPAAMNKPSVTGSGGNIIHVTVNVPQGTSRATADQIGAETGAGIQRSMRKYG